VHAPDEAVLRRRYARFARPRDGRIGVQARIRSSTEFAHASRASAMGDQMRRLLYVLVLAAFSLATAGCLQNLVPEGAAPLRYRDDIFPASAVTKATGLTYGSAPDSTGVVQQLKLDVYQPNGDTATARPAIVWIHGGSFCCGSRNSQEIVEEATRFAQKGFFNVSIDYRLRPGGCSASAPTSGCVQAILDAQHDAQAAVRWLRAHAVEYRIDPDRIAAAGTSAGAITAMQVAYNSEDPGTSGNAGLSSKVHAAVSLSGAQLLGRIDKGEPPALDFHGTNDPLVPYQWAVNTVNNAKKVGVLVELTTYQGEGHVPIGPPGRFDSIVDQTRNFLYVTMDLSHAAR
jgi:acetyl esterase/lipase